MNKTNSNSKGRYKGRQNGHNGNGRTSYSSQTQYTKNSVFDSNGPCGKVRGNVFQIIEKYELAAKDARCHSEGVLAEVCLQYADHYNRIALTFVNEPAPVPKKVVKNEDAEEIPTAPIADISAMDLSIPDFSGLQTQKSEEKTIAVENA